MESIIPFQAELVSRWSGICTLEQAVAQISKGNKNYENYQVVNKSDGTTYIRSKADGIKKNNIEE